MNFRRPPHGQAKASTSWTRFRSSAQSIRVVGSRTAATAMYLGRWWPCNTELVRCAGARALARNASVSSRPSATRSCARSPMPRRVHRSHRFASDRSQFGTRWSTPRRPFGPLQVDPLGRSQVVLLGRSGLDPLGRSHLDLIGRSVTPRLSLPRSRTRGVHAARGSAPGCDWRQEWHATRATRRSLARRTLGPRFYPIDIDVLNQQKASDSLAGWPSFLVAE